MEQGALTRRRLDQPGDQSSNQSGFLLATRFLARLIRPPAVTRWLPITMTFFTSGRRVPLLENFRILTSRGAVVAQHAHLDQAMGLEGGVGFLQDGFGQAIATDHHDGIQVVCVGAQGATLGSVQFNCRHPSIIEP